MFICKIQNFLSKTRLQIIVSVVIKSIWAPVGTSCRRFLKFLEKLTFFPVKWTGMARGADCVVLRVNIYFSKLRRFLYRSFFVHGKWPNLVIVLSPNCHWPFRLKLKLLWLWQCTWSRWDVVCFPYLLLMTSDNAIVNKYLLSTTIYLLFTVYPLVPQ